MATMSTWSDNRVTKLFGIELPIIQAPMAGATTPEMVIAASEAGGLGSLPGAFYSADQLGAALDQIRAATAQPINVNFFTHVPPAPDPARQAAWHRKLQRFYTELGLDAAAPAALPARNPFDETYCAVVERYRPEVVSFHFGLPGAELLDRVRRTGAKIIASATTVAEARWLAERGVDAVIAMGLEAGGHRGNFLTDDMSTQVGTMALVPQVVDAVKVPVIAAGGIADRRGVRAAIALGASAVQVGTAYLFTPEARVSALYLEALRSARDDSTALTNLFTGRPARGIMTRLMRELGPLSADAPAFPTAGASLAPLRAQAEKNGETDFTNLWAGQAAGLGRSMSTGELTRYLADLD
jgi:nitronate monooxygenase